MKIIGIVDLHGNANRSGRLGDAVPDTDLLLIGGGPDELRPQP